MTEHNGGPSWRIVAHVLWAVLIVLLGFLASHLYGRVQMIDDEQQSLGRSLVRIEAKLDVLLEDRIERRRQEIQRELQERGILREETP